MMKDRIKAVRRSQKINLSQEAFGAKIGVTGAAISRMESGVNNPSEQVILSICREYGVNEEWLRHGTGEMFVESEAFSLDEYAASHGCTDLERDLLMAYFDLDPDVRGKALEHFQQSLAKRQQRAAPADTEARMAAMEKRLEDLEKEEASATPTPAPDPAPARSLSRSR